MPAFQQHADAIVAETLAEIAGDFHLQGSSGLLLKLFEATIQATFIDPQRQQFEMARAKVASQSPSASVTFHHSIRRRLARLKEEIALEQASSIPLTHTPPHESDTSLPASASGKVFVVHGHNLALRDEVADILRKLKLVPVILSEQPGSSRTVIELIEQHDGVDYAVCLLTRDDVGGKSPETLKSRARQNVILEVGYFFAKLGRSNVSVIAENDLELPSDIVGLRPIVITPGVSVSSKLEQDLRHAGMIA